MSSEWIETTLGEVLTLQRGIDLPVQDRRVGSVPVVASTGIVGFHNEAPVKGPGVVIGRSGSIGGGQFIRQDFWPLNTTLWVKDFHGNNPKYCYYLLRSMDFSGLNAGSGVPTLNRNHLHPLKVRRPPIDQQRAIANILGGLDEKIDLNRRINQTLEAMAQALFKSWFVDFDPVKAKIAAIQEDRDPLRAAMSAISGKSDAELDALPREQVAHLAVTAALFPDEMEASELGEVPKGWVIEPLSKMIQLIGGGTPKRSEPSYWQGDVLWYSVKDSPLDGDVWAVDTEETITGLGLQNSSTKLIPVGATIISARGTVGKLAMVGKEMAMNQSCYGVTGANGVGSCFNYFNLKIAVEALKRNTHGAVFDTIT